ncbi:MAG TPA: HD domain-containing phosphohydrolase [Geobacteraceae bacterium]|nr:HD domain-containing phosphohydrolase [Geobacteraceae bacterium]
MYIPECGRTKVLFVDDEENILKSLKRLLADEEIEILTATSGEQGLDLLRDTEDVGLIVSDQRMPGLSGADFLRQSREISPDTLRIMLTGYADINATIDAINKGGAYRYISKPWDDEEMIQIIRDAVRQCRLISENKRLSALVRKQNEELQEWNSNLKGRVLEQTAAVRIRSDELRELNEKLRNNYENCLAAFSALVELRDRETENHSRNVSLTSVMVAEKMDLSAEEIEVIKVASLLHDIGKIGISDTLLRGDTAGMSPNELDEYRQHAVRGQAAIDSIEDLRSAGIVIRHHHENFDGSGFPDRLAKGDIPVGARIIALADYFDRIFARKRVDNALEVTLREVESELGRKFDPALFPQMEQVVKERYARLVSKTGMVEMELHSKELREGMVVARELRSGTGLLLLGVGERLDAKQVNVLRRYYEIDPPKKGILVRVPSNR